jgi:hypothetical protein
MSSEEGSKEELQFPKFDYHLDESDPDIVVLRRQDGAFVAAFSARGATEASIVEAAKEDYRELIRVYWERRGEAGGDEAAFGAEGRDVQIRRAVPPPPQ